MNLKSKKGLTLTELMATTLITSMTVFSVIGVFVNMSVVNEFNRERTLAIMHAQHVMEQIKNSHFTGLESAINNSQFNFNASVLHSSPYNFTTLPSESISTSAVSGGNPLLIQVQVDWVSKGQIARSYILQTLKTNGS